jgi:hypothetical protein
LTYGDFKTAPRFCRTKMEHPAEVSQAFKG